MRILFRDIKSNDLEQIRTWRNSEEIRHNLYDESYINKKQQKGWYEVLKKRKDQKHWIIICDKKPVGVINLKDIDYKHKNAEMGFYIGDLSYWNRGAAVLVEFYFLEYIFNELKLHKLNSFVLDFNKKVIRLHKNFGFKQEGLLKEEILKGNRYVDVVMLGMLSKEWRKKRGEFKKIIKYLEKL